MARARRGRGEGSIYQRGDGIWCASLSAGYDANGKRIRRTLTGKTKAVVAEKLRRLQGDVDAGILPSTQRSPDLSVYLTQWLETSVRSTCARETYRRYKTVVDNQLIPNVGRVKVNKLTTLNVEQLYAVIEKSGGSPRTCQLAGITLGKAMSHAEKHGLVRSNPVRLVPKPKVEYREMDVWTEPECQQFLSSSKDDPLFALYQLALTSGMRQGELLGLRWSDIDFGSNTVVVQRTLEEVRGQLREKPPKRDSRRSIVLPPVTMQSLAQHQRNMLQSGLGECPVFCDSNGGWLRKSNLTRRSFSPLVKKAGVRRIRFHDLRHTHATLLLQAGENVKVVSERLGHRSIEITLKIYAHVLPTMQQQAATRLEGIFGSIGYN